MILGLAIELGLRSAAMFKAATRHSHQAEADGNHADILLIGDSILGTMDDDKTAAGQFRLQLKEKNPHLSVQELTVGGMTSEEALRRTRAYLPKHKPSTVFIMIGKNDWMRGGVDRAFSRVAHSWFGRFEVSKVLMILLMDLQRTYRQWYPDSEARAQQAAFRNAWAMYATQDYEAIAEFETHLKEYPGYLRGIQALVHLYYIHWMPEEGIKYLEELRTNSPEAAFIDVHIGYLKSDRMRKKGEKVVPEQFGWDSTIRSVEDQRFAFIAKLRMAHIQEDPEAFAREFLSLGPQQSDVLLPSTLSNLREMIDMYLGKKARVVIVDYPSHHIRPISQALSNYAGEIEVHESRMWLVESLPREKLMSAFTIDCDHLRLLGAEVLGREMVKIALDSSSK